MKGRNPSPRVRIIMMAQTWRSPLADVFIGGTVIQVARRRPRQAAMKKLFPTGGRSCRRRRPPRSKGGGS